MTERKKSTAKKAFSKATVPLLTGESGCFLFSATKFTPNGSKTRDLLSLVYT